MNDLTTPLTFTRGPQMKNRFMLAPLTNTQSRADGILNDEEYKWLTMRAEGGFGLTMTCAAHVQAIGQGFPGQLGVFSDKHLEGLTRLSTAIKSAGSISIVQLHHAGMRSPIELIGEAPLCPSDDKETGSRGITLKEVKALVRDFIDAACRSEKAGFDGVELHGAHGYIICQFLSDEINQRDDEYGGSLENRSRMLFEIIDGIRKKCGPEFILGVRLSPERFGIKLNEALVVAQQLNEQDKIDFLDMSLWDVFKEPEEESYKGRSLLSYFTELKRGNVKLGVAGKIRTPEDAEQILMEGVDWIMLGRAAILHHDFPNQYRQDRRFQPVDLPVTSDYLKSEGLSNNFLTYMGRWPGFIVDKT